MQERDGVIRTSAVPETSTMRVYTTLRREIMAGTISPGARLRAEAVAERYGVSRTPAREAFVMLAREGLLEIIPRRGALVRSFDPVDVRHLYEVRALLEPYAARRAARRISAEDLDRMQELCDEQDALPAGTDRQLDLHIKLNNEFHTIVIRAAHSPRLDSALAAVAGLPAMFQTRFWRNDLHRRESLTCHQALVDALRKQDETFAGSIMRMHILSAIAFLEDEPHQADGGSAFRSTSPS